MGRRKSALERNTMYIATQLGRDGERILFWSLAITNTDATSLLFFRFNLAPWKGGQWTSQMIPVKDFPRASKDYREFLGFFKIGLVLDGWQEKVQKACDHAALGARDHETWCYHILKRLWHTDTIKRAHRSKQGVRHCLNMLFDCILEISRKRYHKKSFLVFVPQNIALLSSTYMVDLNCYEDHLPTS